jgi:hypothetical protein
LSAALSPGVRHLGREQVVFEAAGLAVAGGSHVEVLRHFHVPVTVIDNLDQTRAGPVGQLAGPQTDAHGIACARNVAGRCASPPRPIHPVPAGQR